MHILFTLIKILQFIPGVVMTEMKFYYTCQWWVHWEYLAAVNIFYPAWQFFFLHYFLRQGKKCLSTLKTKMRCNITVNQNIYRARFTNSLWQRKLSFGVKIVLSGFTKDAQWRISTEKAWTQIFLPLTLLNMHLQEFPFQTQNLWEESIKMNHTTRFTFALVKLLVFGPF